MDWYEGRGGINRKRLRKGTSGRGQGLWRRNFDVAARANCWCSILPRRREQIFFFKQICVCVCAPVFLSLHQLLANHSIMVYKRKLWTSGKAKENQGREIHVEYIFLVKSPGLKYHIKRKDQNRIK